MKKTMMMNLLLVLLAAAPITSFAQYFNTLHDCDSTYDGGWDIFLQSDSNYFVIAQAQDLVTYQWHFVNMKISADGHTVLSRNVLQFDSTSIYPGEQGDGKRTRTGGYITPINLVNDAGGGNLRSAGGLIKYSADGDTVFLRKYTDTSINFDAIYTCAEATNSDYFIGGARGLNTPSYYPCLLTRTDSLGNAIWTHTYQKFAADNAFIQNIIPIDHSRIVIGAESWHYNFISSTAYVHNTPWFMILDSAGNILRDTAYGEKYGGGGRIYKDSLGGYVHIGFIDTLETEFPDDYQNFPCYIAHLDTSFHLEWITRFPYSIAFGRRAGTKVLQLHDGGFVVAYAAQINYVPNPRGWAAKVDHNGNMVWNHYYLNDSNQDAYLEDMIEKPDGSLVFTGTAYNDSVPTWHRQKDVWMLGVDSNGCEIPGCSSNVFPQGVQEVHPAGVEQLLVYPNPSYGMLTVKASAPGSFRVYTVQGQLIRAYDVQAGSNNVALPGNLAAGMYMGVYRPESGAKEIVIRLVYQP